MVDRRGTRFVLEALFLAALAIGLALAKLHALEIVGAMVLGWIVVAALEWAAWRGEAHYGSGLPPRYYVPAVNLPPAQPLEQVEQGYPGGGREEAPTWIASAALRAEVLGEWPVALAPVREEGADPWSVAELPPEPVGDPAPVPDAAPASRPAAIRTARHTLDPLGEPAPRRRFGRGRLEEPGVIEVPARPDGIRPLPGDAARS
jgi:hypothetical protein